jgi:hypothetical protein
MALKKMKGKDDAAKRVIFFTYGCMPSESEWAAAAELDKAGYDVFMRNGTTMTGNPEPAARYVGNVPSYFDDLKDVPAEKIERVDFHEYDHAVKVNKRSKTPPKPETPEVPANPPTIKTGRASGAAAAAAPAK